jgi:hypothetical protein
MEAAYSAVPHVRDALRRGRAASGSGSILDRVTRSLVSMFLLQKK